MIIFIMLVSHFKFNMWDINVTETILFQCMSDNSKDEKSFGSCKIIC